MVQNRCVLYSQTNIFPQFSHPSLGCVLYKCAYYIRIFTIVRYDYPSEVGEELFRHVQKESIFSKSSCEPRVNFENFTDKLVSLTMCVAFQRQQLRSLQQFLRLILGFLHSPHSPYRPLLCHILQSLLCDSQHSF